MTKPLRGASFDSVVNRKTALPRTGVARAWRSAAARWKAASTASVVGRVGSAKLGTAGAALSNMEAMVTYQGAVRLPGGARGSLPGLPLPPKHFQKRSGCLTISSR